ncbi:MAG: hypothetical protein MI864_28945, partial [Pseudomonadales bacterium]|nr:hypothetical protein [Pseudomonadales bacterium]
QDEGFLAISDLSLTGAHGTALDEIRLFIDVADGTASDSTAFGASEFGGAGALGKTYLAGAAGAAGLSLTDTTTFDDSIAIGNGDLIIALRGQNGFVDFGLNIGSVDLAQSDATIGSIAGSANTTTLVSDLNLNGLIGPIDMVIHNDGGTAETLEINAYFNVTDQSGGADPTANTLTLPFMNTSLGFALHNNRGDEVISLGSQGTSFAHAQLTVGQSTNGLAVNVKDFSGDMDLTNITMGSSPSIGDLYITDLKVTAALDIYGH